MADFGNLDPPSLKIEDLETECPIIELIDNLEKEIMPILDEREAHHDQYMDDQQSWHSTYPLNITNTAAIPSEV